MHLHLSLVQPHLICIHCIHFADVFKCRTHVYESLNSEVVLSSEKRQNLTSWVADERVSH